MLAVRAVGFEIGAGRWLPTEPEPRRLLVRTTWNTAQSNADREWASDRRRRVEHVLHAYGVPLELRDGSNLVTGLLAVRPEALPKGQLSVARRDAAPSTWSTSGLAAAVGAALPWINAEAFAADVIAGRPVLVDAQGTCTAGALVVVSDVCELTGAVYALPTTMAVVEEGGGCCAELAWGGGGRLCAGDDRQARCVDEGDQPAQRVRAQHRTSKQEAA